MTPNLSNYFGNVIITKRIISTINVISPLSFQPATLCSSTLILNMFPGSTDSHSEWLSSYTCKVGSCNPTQLIKSLNGRSISVRLCLSMCSCCSFDLLTSVCRQKPAPCLVLAEQRQQKKKSSNYHVAISLTSGEAAHAADMSWHFNGCNLDSQSNSAFFSF